MKGLKDHYALMNLCKVWKAGCCLMGSLYIGLFIYGHINFTIANMCVLEAGGGGSFVALGSSFATASPLLVIALIIVMLIDICIILL